MNALFLFAALFGFLIIGVPIAVALGLASILTILLFQPDSLASPSMLRSATVLEGG